MTGSNLAVDISRISGDQRNRVQDAVAVEEPLEIQLNSPTAANCAAKSISITMRTPGDDAELAVGFLFSEQIIRDRSDLASVSHVGGEDNNTIRVELAAGVEVDLERLQRHFYMTSSCGVCGKASLDALTVGGLSPFTTAIPVFSRELLVAMPDRLRRRQELFSQTGGLHAAALFDSDGSIIALKEDVGRHNAVDKVVGELLLRGDLPAGTHGLLVSGRASFELMQKSLVAGIPLLAAIGAPSSLAIQLADRFNMTLIGFLRQNSFNVYSCTERVTN